MEVLKSLFSRVLLIVIFAVVLLIAFTQCSGVKPNVMPPQQAPYGVVYVMLTECKISQAMTPSIREISEKYVASGYFEFKAYFPESYLSEDADLGQWAASYDLTLPCLIDSGDRITQSLGASRAPQVIVIHHETDEIVYSGRINNLFAALGKRRAQVTDHTLDSVLQQIVDGLTVSPKVTEVIGCSLN